MDSDKSRFLVNVTFAQGELRFVIIIFVLISQTWFPFCRSPLDFAALRHTCDTPRIELNEGREVVLFFVGSIDCFVWLGGRKGARFSWPLFLPPYFRAATGNPSPTQEPFSGADVRDSSASNFGHLRTLSTLHTYCR